jgi:glycosyltransferase involved in cell wall biosynthesis
VRELLDVADIFVLAARQAESGDRDGIPVALMEAMARGVPVVTTRLGAIPELVDGAGVLVEADDPRQLATAISSLFDRQLWTEQSVAGRQRVAKGFIAEQSVVPLIGLLGRVGRDEPRHSRRRHV